MKSQEPMPGVSRKSVESAGRRTIRQVIHCAECGSEEPTGGGNVRFYPPEALAKFFTQKGWRVAKRGDHTCPTCITKEAEAMAEAPRDPQPADNRKIFARLMEVYDEKNGRYCDDFTDHSVAKDLGVPRRWVEAIREANFGPAGKNAEMDKVAAAIGSMAAEAKKHADEAMALAARSEDLVRRAEELRDRLHKIELAVGPRAA
jgi:hypothetical protein